MMSARAASEIDGRDANGPSGVDEKKWSVRRSTGDFDGRMTKNIRAPPSRLQGLSIRYRYPSSPLRLGPPGHLLLLLLCLLASTAHGIIDVETARVSLAHLLVHLFNFDLYNCRSGHRSREFLHSTGQAKGRGGRGEEGNIMTTTMNEARPHPLKGIVNSNDDPTVCAVCSGSVRSTSSDGQVSIAFGAVCCGRAVCKACDLEDGRGCICPICRAAGVARFPPAKEIAGMVKKNAKRGFAWAQCDLSSLYRSGIGVQKSVHDSNRWAEKAAKQGHPKALFQTGVRYLRGVGRSMDLERARKFLQAAINSGCDCRDALVDVACEYLRVGSNEAREEAKSILLPLTTTPRSGAASISEIVSSAHFHLGRVFRSERNTAMAYDHFVSSILYSAVNVNSCSFDAMLCAELLGLHAQRRFWAGKVKMSSIDFFTTDLQRRGIMELLNTQRDLRQMRDTCGGCGVAFEGKERKFCRGCRTYCYCSRECQKIHWNRKDDGHREDCWGLKEVKQKLKEARCHFIDAKPT